MSGRGDHGFTLVEALVSLFVFGLVATGAVAMLAQSVDTHRRVGEAEQDLREVQTVRALLVADLSQFVARQSVRSDGAPRPAFIGGDADVALGFVRAAAEQDPEQGALSRLIAVEYRLDEGRLLRRAYPLAGAGANASDRVLIEDATEARFEFFDGVTWRPQWIMASSSAAPPRAVALVYTSRRYGEMRIEALTGLGA